MVGVGVYLLLRFVTLRLTRSVNSLPVFIAAELTLITVVTLAGIWAGSRAEKLLGRKDPGKVVIDEVAGQLIALLPIASLVNTDWTTIIVAFLLFRLFDIIKPYPSRRFEDLEAGLGIMSDDLVAGAYAALGVALFIVIGLVAFH